MVRRSKSSKENNFVNITSFDFIFVQEMSYSVVDIIETLRDA